MSDIEIVSNQLKFVKPDVKLSYFGDEEDEEDENEEIEKQKEREKAKEVAKK